MLGLLALNSSDSYVTPLINVAVHEASGARGALNVMSVRVYDRVQELPMLGYMYPETRVSMSF